jgi:hypothetical protein
MKVTRALLLLASALLHKSNLTHNNYKLKKENPTNIQLVQLIPCGHKRT